MSSKGWRAACEPDVAARVGTWTYNGDALGLRRTVERVYGVSSIVLDGVLWFGGDRRLQKFEFGLGGGDPARIEEAVRRMLGNKGHVVRVGGKLVVLATPVMIETIRQVQWFAESDYQVKIVVYELIKTKETGIKGELGMSVSPGGVGWNYSLDAAFDRTTARLVRSWKVTVVPGEETSLDVGEERMVTRYKVDEDSRLQSGTEMHRAGLNISLNIGELAEGIVSLGYEVEASAFSADEGVGRRVSTMRGGLRCRLNGEYLMGEYEGDVARRWLGLNGAGVGEDMRRVLIRVRVVGGQRLQEAPAVPPPLFRASDNTGGCTPADSGLAVSDLAG